jgi:hypothetical protein
LQGLTRHGVERQVFLLSIMEKDYNEKKWVRNLISILFSSSNYGKEYNEKKMSNLTSILWKKNNFSLFHGKRV